MPSSSATGVRSLDQVDGGPAGHRDRLPAALPALFFLLLLLVILGTLLNDVFPSPRNVGNVLTDRVSCLRRTVWNRR